MEGDVESILARPTLPPSSPDPSSTNVHRYTSKDLRARETQAEIEKWDAWHACAGMSRTEAKRKYISTLIETMKVYASGTPESRELISELEFVWAQIRSQSGSSEDEADTESPISRLQRAGLGLQQADSYASIPPGEGGGPGGPTEQGAGGENDLPLRVLSPVSRGEIVEGEDAARPEARDGGEVIGRRGASDQDGEAKPLDRRRSPSSSSSASPSRSTSWHRQIEAAIQKMSAEIAALREQMSDSRVFTAASSRRDLPFRVYGWLRWLLWATLRHLLANAVLVLLVVLWGRWRGDQRAEQWVTRRWKDLTQLVRTLTSSLSVWRRIRPQLRTP